MTTEQRSVVCPDAQQLAAYVDGRLTAAERAAIQRHLADCDECRELVADAVRLRRDSAERPVLPFWRRPARAVGGVLALAASLMVVVLVWPDLNPFRPTPYEELVAAVGPQRPVEGRLTGGFEFGPLRSPTRSGGGVQSGSYEVLAAAAKLQQQADRSPSAAHLHGLGVAELVLGDADAAIDYLDRAAAEQPAAPVLSDLAAAHLARGSAERDDFAAAVRHADRAIASDPSLTEAYFNRALALESLQQRDAARAAWEAYIRIDPSSGWGDEARRRLERLGSSIGGSPTG